MGAGGAAVARHAVRRRPDGRPVARGVHGRDRPLDAEPHDGREHARLRGPGPAADPPRRRAAVPPARRRGADEGHDPGARERADRRVRGPRRGRPVHRVRRPDERSLAPVHARARRGRVGGPPALEPGPDARARELRGRSGEAGAGRRGERVALRGDRTRPGPARGRARRLRALGDAPSRRGRRPHDARGDRREHQADALGRAAGAARRDRARDPRARLEPRAARGGAFEPAVGQGGGRGDPAVGGAGRDVDAADDRDDRARRA